MTSSEARLRGLAPGQHSSRETSQRWRAVVDTVSDLTEPVIELESFTTPPTGRELGVFVKIVTKMLSYKQAAFLG